MLPLAGEDAAGRDCVEGLRLRVLEARHCQMPWFRLHQERQEEDEEEVEEEEEQEEDR